jgi:hypothetical protein
LREYADAGWHEGLLHRRHECRLDTIPKLDDTYSGAYNVL